MSQTISSVLTLVAQIVISYLLEFGLYVIGIGNGVELMALPLMSTLAVWGIGHFFAKRHAGSALVSLVATLLGSALGVWLIWQIGAVGFIGLFTLPLLGALFGYYFGRSLAAAK